MYLGRVTGTVVATRIYPGLEGRKLLLVAPLDHRQRHTAGPLVAVDTVRAGEGDLVYLVSSREAALALEPWFVPVDAAIVGIVDQLAAEEAQAAGGAPWPEVFHGGRGAAAGGGSP